MNEENREITAKKENPLGVEPVRSLLLRFAIPSIIAMLVSALYNIVDQLFIGQAVGTLGNAATNVAYPLSISCIALALTFGVGGASCFNLNMGRGNKEKAVYYAGNAIVCLIISGLLLCLVTQLWLRPMLLAFGATDTVLPYAQTYVRITSIGFPFLILTTGGCHLVRADGSPTMAMACNLTGAIINTVLDAIFVLGLHWGMAGAATATIIGQIVSAIMVIVYLTGFKTVPLLGKHLRPRATYVLEMIRIGMASFLNQVSTMIVQIILNNSLTFYGAMSVYGSDIPLACAGIVIKIFQVFFSIVIGLSQGSQPVASFNYGAKKYDRVRSVYRQGITAAIICSVIAFLCFQIFPRQILSLFGSGTPEYFEFGVMFFRTYLFCIWLDALQPYTTTFFTAIGKPARGIFLSLTRQIIFYVPLLLILPRFFGVVGCCYVGAIADGLAAVVTIIVAAQEFRHMPRTAVPLHED